MSTDPFLVCLCLFQYQQLRFNRPISGMFVFVSIPVELHFNRPISGLFVFVSIPGATFRQTRFWSVFVSVQATFGQTHLRFVCVCFGTGSYSSADPFQVCLCLFQYQWSYISTDSFLVCLCLLQYLELRFNSLIRILGSLTFTLEMVSKVFCVH